MPDDDTSTMASFKAVEAEEEIEEIEEIKDFEDAINTKHYDPKRLQVETREVKHRLIQGLAYNTGYGDFCFGRPIDHKKCKYPSCDSLIPESEERNVLFEELGEFHRYALEFNHAKRFSLTKYNRNGPFEFSRLPIEIRLKIIRLLLEPFFRYREGLRTSYLNLWITSFSPKRDDREAILYSGDYDNYVSELKKLEAAFSSGAEKDLSPNERKKQMDAFEYHRWRYWHAQANHPLRTENYQMIMHAMSVDRKARLDHWPMIQLLRDLSNVSPQIRHELAKVLWTRVHLKFDEVSEACYLLPRFLNERPAACKSIKSISLRGFTAKIELAPSILKQFSEFVSEKLDLDEVKVHINIREPDLVQLAEGKGNLAWMSVFVRSLKISRTFLLYYSTITLNLRGKREVGDPDLSNHEYGHYLRKKYGPAIRDFLLPDTLREASASIQGLAVRTARLSASP